MTIHAHKYLHLRGNIKYCAFRKYEIFTHFCTMCTLIIILNAHYPYYTEPLLPVLDCDVINANKEYVKL